MISHTLSQKIMDHLSSLESDGMSLFMLENGTIRGALLHGSRMVNQMRANHKLGIMETLILGHAYLGAAVISRMLKGEDRIVLSVECGGPVKGLSVEVNALGRVRGYLKESNLEIKEALESFDTSPFYGPGFLSVTKHIAGNSQPFTGQVMLEYGTMARDLVNYFHVSEQIPTAVALSVFFGPDGAVAGAGGLFLQALPGAPDNALAAIEQEIGSMPSLGKYFASGATRRDFIDCHFASFSPEYQDEQPVEFFCSCSRERFSSFLAGISDREKMDILKKKDFPLKTTCYNCNSTYEFSEKEIHTLFSN
ncbi:MAG: Hsp33 family molecular chaperone HslO [Spirochaetales bacterium]|nr:Hsp33 family molecular chaperone HslO [Spirochaetales bacterium]